MLKRSLSLQVDDSVVTAKQDSKNSGRSRAAKRTGRLKIADLMNHQQREALDAARVAHAEQIATDTLQPQQKDAASAAAPVAPQEQNATDALPDTLKGRHDALGPAPRPARPRKSTAVARTAHSASVSGSSIVMLRQEGEDG